MALSRLWRSPALVLGLAVGLSVAGLAGAFAVSVDQAATSRLPVGTIIESVPVGGLDVDTAVVRAREAVEEPLRRPVVLKADGYEVTTTPWELGYRVDVADTVRTALDRGRDGNVLTRLGSRILGPAEPMFVDPEPAWTDGQLDAVLAEAAAAVAQPPEMAGIDLSTGFVQFTPERAGVALDVEASRQVIVDAIPRGASTVRLETDPVPPGERDPALDKVILVRTGENMLYLYDRGVIVKSWPVATGTASYPTPTGIYEVTAKIENPSWYNPGSDWARGLPRVIGPGPSNPLGTKALQLSAPAILIHATSDRGSIGYSASHGCIRMTEEDEAELFSMVDTGTRVAIVEAGPPVPRGSRTPDPPTPEETAVVIF